MDPPHVTEFASAQYFKKIDQLAKQQPDGHAAEGVLVQSQFILPIRQADHQADELLKPGDQKRAEREREKEKERNGIFRRLLSSKSSIPVPEPQSLRRLSTASTLSIGSTGETTTAKHRSLSFDQLFSDLPMELRVQVIALLPLSDVLNLRLASRQWHAMVTFNEVTIVRYHLAHQIPTYATRLYPIPETANLNLHYLCGLWHRLHVAAKLSWLMSEWITKEIFLKTTEEQKAAFSIPRERMRRRLIPLLFTIFHFFETYRTLHLEYIKEHGHGLERTPYTLNPIEAQIMNMYDDRTLLQVHQVFPVVVSSFCRRLRPPSYAGIVERALTRHWREKPPDEVHTAVLCLGGLRQVLRLWEVKGYNSRREAVDVWYKGIQETKKPGKAVEVSKDSMPWKGLIRRRKSSWQVRDAIKSQDDNVTGPPTRDSSDQVPTRNSMTAPNLIFGTSLSAGMPMEPLEEESYKLLLPNLPVLRELWLSTAETLVLERRIVERPVDIKRNGQVMLDLIKDEGVVEEDIWWYGNRAPTSIQSSLEAIEEDPIG